MAPAKTPCRVRRAITARTSTSGSATWSSERALLRERAAGQRLRLQAHSDVEGGVVAIFTERLQRGRPILINGTGEQRRDLVYVADVVDSLLTMAQSDQDGTWNVGTGVSTSILELLRALESEIGPATEVRYGPPRPG